MNSLSKRELKRIQVMNENERIKILCEDFGYSDPMDMAEEYMADVCAPAICTECHHTTEMEQDQDAGWCEDCEQNTVVSLFILMGII